MTRSRFWIGLGAAGGFVIWMYDYQFFLNAGGPKIPISRAILHASKLEYANALVFVFWPLLVLVICGAVVGFIVSFTLTGKSSTGRTKS
jgi:hypothetical protein